MGGGVVTRVSRMRDALRRLARDDWVVGIAAAIALGYASVVLVHALARAGLQAVDGDGFHYQESLVLLAINDGVPASAYESPDGIGDLFAIRTRR